MGNRVALTPVNPGKEKILKMNLFFPCLRKYSPVYAFPNYIDCWIRTSPAVGGIPNVVPRHRRGYIPLLININEKSVFANATFNEVGMTGFEPATPTSRT